MNPHHHPPRLHAWSRNRWIAFWGVTLLVGGISLLFVLGMGAVVFSLLDLPRPSPHMMAYPGRLLGVICGVPLVFFLLISVLGGISFRRFGKPLADMISAADAVARGDLSVRLHAVQRGPLGSLARSFNHMTTELERAERQRRNLTADVAHELRTPLHIIQGNLEGMLDGVYEPSPENLNATLDETRLLARLVSDLQTLSLAEAGALPLHSTRFAVSDLLEDVAISFSKQAEEQGVQVEVQSEAAAGLELEADYDRLDQVLSNLVANALRYTPSGGRITLSAAAQEGGVQLSVADTGAGIPPEDLPYIFDRFWKGDRARKRGEGAGSGLGLAIARQLVRMHGGTIQVQSQPGAGTVFTIHLPLCPPEPLSEPG